MNPFSSADQFRTLFHDGLNQLLELADVTAGQVVLVMANAIVLQDRQLLEKARPSAKRQLTAASGENEDTAVLKLILAAADPFDLIQHRTTPAGRRLEYNELRAHRPKREAQAAATTVHRPFEPEKFNFTRIPHEAYWRGQRQGSEVAFFFNKYPIAPYHTSVVPSPDSGHEQFLSKGDHGLARALCRELATTQPGVVIAYNGLGAYASLNHLHYQMVPDAVHLPLMSTSDLTQYPVSVGSFDNEDTAWQQIDHLQNANRPFNLIMTPERTILIERKFQGSYNQPGWTTGFAWYELSGGIITVDRTAYETLTDEQIDEAFRATAP